MKFEELLSKQEKKGRKDGLDYSIITILSTKGEVTSDIREKIKLETDMEVLSEWVELAIQADSIEAFVGQIY